MNRESPLERHLKEAGRMDLLLSEERELLQTAEVRALPPAEQWNYLATNRRVGYWIAAVVGTLRLLLLAGGAIAAVIFSSDQLAQSPDTVVWLLLLVAGIALLWAARTTLSLRGRLRDLGRRLPPFADLGMPDESASTSSESSTGD